MRLAPAYDLVRDELAQVEAALAGVRHIAAFPEMESMLAQVLDPKGKRLRPLVALLAGRFGTKPSQLAVPLAAAVELLHTATLIHDDVIDSSETRRGRPTANALFDNREAVVLGDYVLASAAELITETRGVGVIRVFTQALKTLVSGELRQDLRAFDYSETIDDYFRRITEKTASLFAASASGAALLTGASEFVEPLRQYGESVGIAFQIVDDMLDFSGDESEMGKPVANDLLHGTLTLPALLLIGRQPAKNVIAEYFAQKDRVDLVGEAVRAIRSSGILEEVHATALTYRGRALNALRALPATEAREALKDLADFAVERRT